MWPRKSTFKSFQIEKISIFFSIYKASNFVELLNPLNLIFYFLFFFYFVWFLKSSIFNRVDCFVVAQIRRQTFNLSNNMSNCSRFCLVADDEIQLIFYLQNILFTTQHLINAYLNGTKQKYGNASKVNGN